MPAPPRDDRPTPVLTTAAKVLRALSPNALASLAVVESETATTQTDIASIIGRDQSTVSTYFRSLELEAKPIALVEKVGQHYAVTDAGGDVLDTIAAVLDEFGVELESIDWEDAGEKDRIEDALAPLVGSRSNGPFFLLDSLATRSAVGTLHSGSRAVGIGRVVHDVERRTRERGETTSNRQVRQMLDRFTTHGVCMVEDDDVTLTEKGQRHARLLNDVAAVVDQHIEPVAGSTRDEHELLDQVALEMRRGRIATAWSIENADERLQDTSHFYHLIRRIDVLDAEHAAFHSFRRLTIENVSDEPTNSIVHKESGEYKIGFEDLNLVARSAGEDGQQLQVRDITDEQPAFEQKAEIFFPTPLSPGDLMTIEYRIDWPNELAHYSSEERTQSISLTRYHRGVGQLEYGIVDTAEHVGIGCEKLVLNGDDDEWKWKPLPYTPEPVDAESSDISSAFENGQSGYLYKIGSPTNLAYRICYTPVE